MSQKYPDLYALIESDSAAKKYFESLPETVRSSISQRADGVNSFESLCSYADHLTQGDR